MTTQIQTGDTEITEMCSAKDVETYLRNHPEFFKDYSELLSQLVVPHPSGTAVSLIERQVTLLRQENNKLRHRIKELVEIARDNETLIARLHGVSVELVKARNIEEFLDILNNEITEKFSANIVSIKLFAPEFSADSSQREEIVSAKDEGLANFEKFIYHKKPVCGRFNPLQLNFLFESQADLVKSMALVPLVDGETIGMVAIASDNADHFRAGMSTLFLSSLSDIASAILKRFQ